MYCKDCRHWQEGGDRDYSKIVGGGYCKRATQFWDSTEWDKCPTDNEGWGEVEIIRVRKNTNDLHFVQDGSDYMANLITLPDFGCVQFESKEE